MLKRSMSLLLAFVLIAAVFIPVAASAAELDGSIAAEAADITEIAPIGEPTETPTETPTEVNTVDPTQAPTEAETTVPTEPATESPTEPEIKVFEAPVVSLNNAETGVMIRWTPREGAEKYRIFYYGRNGWTKMAETTDSSFLDTDVRSGNTYIYTVRCISADGERYTSDYRDGVKIFYVAAPHITSFKNTEDGVKITWDAVKGAAYYRIYYNNENSWTKLASISENEYVDTTVKGGETRVYTVRAMGENGEFLSDYIARGWSNQFIEAPTVSLENVATGVMISWTPCAGAEKYRIFYYGRNGWTKMAETTDSSYQDTDVRSGGTYIYTVRCISADGERYTGDFRSGKTIRFLSVPEVTSIKNTEDGAKLSWEAVKGADYYRIYYKTQNGWSRLATKDTNEYVDTSVKSGETRTYTVRALDENSEYFSDFENNGWSNRFIAAPVVSLNNAETGVMIRWTACEGAEKYRVFYYGRNGWTKMAETTSTSYLDTDVRSGNTYIYTVRCISADGKRYTGDYRAGKNILYVAAPHITYFENLENGAQVNWSAEKGAVYYRVYYKSQSGWSYLGTKAETRFVDTTVKDGETRTYTVRCIDKNGNILSDYIAKGWNNTFHAAPKIYSITSSGNGNIVKWEASKNVAGYRLYRKVPGGSWGRLFNAISGTSYTDTSSKGKVVAYTVRCVDKNGNLISDYRGDVRFYKDGKLANGNIAINGVYYGFYNGNLLTGLNRIGGKLYYYNNNGIPYRDTIIKTGSDYYYADKDGVLWESKEMRLAAEFIERYCKGDTIREKVKYGFMYLANNYTYQRVYNDMPHTPDDLPPFAEELFTLKRGTCYRYASGFAYMAKIAGYRSRFCFGYSGVLQHGWTEVYVDGEWLICDVDAQLPTYPFDPYDVYMVRNHVWILDKYWHSELTVKNGKAEWGPIINY